MHCPFCGGDDTRVVDSRLASEGDQVRRRRECTSCNERFSTYEIAVFNMPQVTKSGGEKQAFNEHKLRAGLMRATQKRPVDSKSIDRAVMDIQKRILAREGSTDKNDKSDLTTNLIGEFVMEELRKLDDVAYIRFASVYRDFNDIGEFIDAIEGLENSPSPELKKRQNKLPGT
ncbi:transcriptional regulator NrdR [Cocleimonas sp. KMM 6892]|uniref:transcriptional regulator NrdR n=1 Tax=unclassified Cocleimonas TaxID=2639732 RepID=UPI002DBF0A8E|nr:MULTISPECIES: transcriptional regulator NrdR [unclassified Cocleimonas]MEB8432027.1 transcriptional regulator NrdR [Cocleimonas sp. KMM 6892]MEC4714887.1 transcriptional regulator NrdR [Cocleimonas sp. KMM 6895]MEC4744299.1 transcriptional regulator NrdR [Cocleimonas sp. KMM 6896]